MATCSTALGFKQIELPEPLGRGSIHTVAFQRALLATESKLPIPAKNQHLSGARSKRSLSRVHFTPSADATPVVSIGPTATVAFGRENYRGLEAVEPGMAAANIGVLARQYLTNRGGFRRYVHEQAFLALPPLLIRAAQELIPAVKPEHIELSQKVGIRSQLFNRTTERLQDDFLCLPGPCSTHVLNAISPAFTASFALADLIIDLAIPELNLG